LAKKKTIKLSTRALIVLESLDDSCFPKRSIQSCSIYNFPNIPFFLNFQHFFNRPKLTSKRRNKTYLPSFRRENSTNHTSKKQRVSRFIPPDTSSGRYTPRRKKARGKGLLLEPKKRHLTIKSPLLISLKVHLAKITYQKNRELLQPLFNGRYIHRKPYENIWPYTF